METAPSMDSDVVVAKADSSDDSSLSRLVVCLSEKAHSRDP